ncbi:MAG: DEAD/DEAH box helicase [Planctomycetes bacterium]|jgi:superfamily II DNA or RNA helicase|nr:DEAD/DEAH box helicase [Planctomycetota bacterium]
MGEVVQLGQVGAREMTLRPYQQQALSEIERHLRLGKNRLLVAMPTGTGKTVTFAQLPSRLAPAKRTLIIAHREELLDQAARKIAAISPDLTVGVEQADRRAGDAQVMIASIQTLQGRRLADLNPEDFGLVIIDECHHSTAKTFTNVLGHMGFLSGGVAPMPLIGWTATPNRADQVGLGAVFEEIAYDYPLLQAMRDGWLAPIRGLQVKTGIDLSEVSTRAGDFAVAELAKVVNQEERHREVLAGYLQQAQDRTRTVAFCVDVAHAEQLCASFRAVGRSSEVLTGATPRDERREILARFAAGDLQVLTNCMVLTEGFDEPRVDCILMCRPTKSSLLYMQMIGRGIRRSPGKSDCLVLDFTGQAGRHKLITLNTLFGLPPRMRKVDRPERVLEQLQLFEEKFPWIDTSKIETLENLALAVTEIQFFAADVPPELSSWTTLQWTPTTDGEGYVLAMTKRRRMVVRQDRLGRWSVRFLAPPAASLDRPPMDTLRGALKEAEAMAEEQDPQCKKLLDTRAAWRNGPATDKQLELLKRMRIPHPPAITKGQAAMILTRAFNRKG